MNAVVPMTSIKTTTCTAASTPTTTDRVASDDVSAKTVAADVVACVAVVSAGRSVIIAPELPIIIGK